MEFDDLTLSTADSRQNRGWWLRVFGEGMFLMSRLPSSGDVVIGRGSEASVLVKDQSISRCHAKLIVGKTLRIEDLGSKNGTRVGGQRMARGETREIKPGEVFEIGSLMALVQWGMGTVGPRRIWNHNAFEARLEGECARVARSSATFAVARVRIESGVTATVEQILSSAIHASDMIASYAAAEYELLLIDTSAEDARQLLVGVADKLAAGGSVAKWGLACFPSEGRDAEELIAAASAAVRQSGPSDLVVVKDAAMQQLFTLAAKVAAGDISVLLLGETGVGKEVLAETIHRESPRASKPLLRLNCVALSESLLESELFGHEKGAFTGASQLKAGLLETADGGTVFLDEVGELPPTIQAKFLRVLEDRKVTRVGGLKPRAIDVRFVAATNRNLEADVHAGRFRQDLFFRLNGVSLVIPPLRDRRSEIEPLARAFLARACRSLSIPRPPELSAEALKLLTDYAWPGNIRELRNAIERAVLLCGRGPITLDHLPVEKVAATRSTAVGPAPGNVQPIVPADLRAQVSSFERQQIVDALARCNGNQSRAAKQLGISRTTLIARLDAYGVPRPRKGLVDELETETRPVSKVPRH